MSKEGGDKFNDMVGKHNFVKDGAIKLPPGFRFQPTEQEIVFQYLIRKTISCPLPATIIPELFNISRYSPRDLPGDWEQDKYFFSKRIIDSSMYGNGNGNRGAFNLTDNGSGFWKETGLDMQISPPATIRYCGNNRSRREIAIMGMKKTLVYVKGGHRTRWIMHEYRLLHSLNPSTQTSWVQMGDWLLCHIFLRKTSCRKTRRDGRMLEENYQVKSVVSRQQKRLYDSISIGDSTSSSSSLSDSSVITEVSSSRIF